MKTIALINSLAGSVGASGSRRLRSALAKVGLDHANIRELDRQDSKGQLKQIENEAPDLLIVWGGDGTHRSVLETLGRRTSQLLLLPGGTMSLLPKWLHGDKPWEEVLRSVLASPTTRSLSAGKIGESLFFCAMLAGIPARFAEAREDIRRGNLGRAMHDAGVALDSVRRTHLKASFGSDRRHTDHTFPPGNLVGALVGPLATNKRMEVVRSLLPSELSALEMAWTSFGSNWRARLDVAVEPADLLVVEDADGQDIAAIIDGECIEVGQKLQVTFVEEAAACLVANAALPNT